MSITKELREYASNLAGMLGASVTDVKSALEDIADRIDQEHDREFFDMQREHDEWVHDRDANYIPLPKDADGVTIRIGDEVDVINYEPGTVASLQLNERGWLVAVRPHGWDTPTVYCHESIRHAKPDSWERIIFDALRQDRTGTDAYTISTSAMHELVERCKRLAGDE